MSAQCDQVMQGVGTGVAAALRAVDCMSTEMTGSAFGRLFAPGGAMVTTLTILLTLYIAFFAIQLLLGRSSLGIGSLTPRFLTLGLVLTVATSWVAYQTLVANVAIGAPDYLASLLTGNEGSATQTFGDKIDIVFAAVQQATGQGAAATGGADAGADVSTFSPEGLVWMGATLFLLGTVGVLVTARIGLAVLIALGPIFVVMALFNGTRGLFTGWLKGVLLLSLTPLFAVLAGSIMLELSVPILTNLAAVPGQIDAQAAMAFFMVGAVHVALMIMALKVASTMVAGWRIFGFVPQKERDIVTVAAPASTAATPTRANVGAATATTGQPVAVAAARRIDMPTTTAIAANDTGGSSASSGRTAKIVAGGTSGSVTRPTIAAPSGRSARTRGIGNRFRTTHTASLEKAK